LDKEENERRKKDAEGKQGKKDNDFLMRTSTQFRKESKEFDEVVKRVYSVAADYLIDTNTGKLKPTSAFNPAGDNALALAYVQATNPKYRGSVAEIRALEKFEGVPQKTWQAIKNTFNGKELAQDVRTEMFDVIRRTFVATNETQRKREDNLRAQLKERNPDLSEEDLNLYIPRLSLGAPKKADQYNKGQVYEDASGNKAKYLGDGKWEAQ